MGLSVTLDDVTDDIRSSPDRLLVYGVEGVGKTTFAAGFPSPIFLDLEGSTARLPVKRMDLAGEPYSIVREAIDILISEKHAYKTMVLDTADALETKVQQDVMLRGGWKSMSDAAYGKAYDMAAEVWRSHILVALDMLRTRRGMDIVILAHSKIAKFNNPDGPDYDTYEPKLYKSVTPLIKEWVEAILFAAFEQTVVGATRDGDKGKVRATGGRVLHTHHSGAFVAKNRWGLPPMLPLDARAYLKERAAFREKNPAILYLTAQGLIDGLVEAGKMTAEEADKARDAIHAVRWDASKLNVVIERLNERLK